MCMHKLYTVVIPYYVLIRNYMKTFGKCNLAPTHHHTVQCHIHFHKLFQHGFWHWEYSWGEKAIKVSLTVKRSIEIEKWLKKEIAGDFLCAGDEMLFVDSRISIYSRFQLRLNQVKRCCLLQQQVACDVCTQACPKLFYNHLVVKLWACVVYARVILINIARVVYQITWACKWPCPIKQQWAYHHLHHDQCLWTVMKSSSAF